ncbi:MAG: M20/M25/M40 family metallo-hydrolase, partial [Clostridia bacterium]|nr:M20/M25/M40 family metallo-hydrolase [Clostridia bacterium]
MDMDRLFKECERLNEKYISFLIDICNISSKSDNKAGVDAVCEHCASFARNMGYDVEVLPINGSGNVMCATLNPNAEGEPVCMSAHMDTVHPEGLFGVRREGDTLIGPGVYDCKGGIAVGFLVMEALKNCGYTSSPVKMILQSDEENSSRTSNKTTIQYMLEQAKDSVAFLNLESCKRDNQACICRKGIAKYKIEV